MAKRKAVICVDVNVRLPRHSRRSCLSGHDNNAVVHAMRTFDLPPAQIGLTLALFHTGGVIFGGWVTDKWKTRTRRAPALMPAIVLICLIPALLLMMFVTEYDNFLVGYLLIGILSSLASGGFRAVIQELVLPRMRGSASACQALISIIVIFGTGPYLAGKVSTVTGSLTAGLMSMLLIAPVALFVLWLLARRLDDVTPERREAIAYGACKPGLPAGSAGTL